MEAQARAEAGAAGDGEEGAKVKRRNSLSGHKRLAAEVLRRIKMVSQSKERERGDPPATNKAATSCPPIRPHAPDHFPPSLSSSPPLSFLLASPRRRQRWTTRGTGTSSSSTS